MSALGRARRAARRVLAYPAVRRMSLEVVAKAPVVKQWGNAVLGPPPARARHGRIDIRPGRFFAGDLGRTLPVVALVATGLGPGDTEVLAHEVELAQMTTGSFRPLFVVDSGELAPFRTRSFAVEVLMTPESYEAVNPHDSYDAYLHERVEQIAHGYRVAAVVPLPPGRLDLPRPLLRLVGTLPRR